MYFGASKTRSPLQRFRAPPKKSLSVTDLVSPAWCELQYFYSLVKHGHIKRTSVMKQGSTVHQTLEEQVYKTIAIDAATTEDVWGLRLWNVIQGLRTLRETGMTRELEVWGIVDGLLVRGIIDEISFICPDEELEAESLSSGCTSEEPATRQARLSGIYPEGRKARVPPRKVYLTDVKTRVARNLPSGASFRPTLFQLMLYHRFFSNLASNNFDADILFKHYQVDVSVGLSDSFISQVAALDGYNRNIARSGMGGTESDKSQGLLELLLGSNSVQGLWKLMVREFQLTIPAGRQGVGRVLKAEYRSQTDGSILGQKTFLHQDQLLDQYLMDEMMWWRGEREGRGVVIEEAYKCQSCEFAGNCTWRIAKGEQLSRKEQI
jgi:exonuclease V